MPNNEFYYVLHLMELQPNVQRNFSLYINDNLGLASYSPPYLKPGFIYNDALLSSNTEYVWDLNSSGLSLLPPIFNALEVYSPMYLTNLATNATDSDAIMAIKNEYQVIKNWVGDPCSPQKFAWKGLNCSYGSDAPRITSLDLSSSSLTGNISSDFSALTALESLDLSNNSLTGEIPSSLGNLSSLKMLNLKCNNLTGQIPDTLLKRSQAGLLTISVEDDTNSCTRKPTPKKKISTPIIVVISVIPALLLLILVAFVVSRIFRRKDLPKETPTGPEILHPVTPQPGIGCDVNAEIQLQSQQQFTYAQLEQMTNNFAKVIGGGGFGTVYLGYLQNGKQVAVKKRSQATCQGTKEFLVEALYLTRIHHRNLVSLVGFCMDVNCKALVYQYMSQGSLSDHLRGKGGRYKVLSWENRLRIAAEAAQGIEYLHKGCNPPLIHRDVKSSIILLGDKLEAKIADFGLSRALDISHESYVSAQSVVGTTGYLDPEYHTNFRLSDKSDIYSFGIVLLEIITGQPPVIPGKTHIIQWVAPKLERGEIDDIIDRNLRGEYDANSLWKVVDLAMKCTAEYGSQRPTMSVVVAQLKESLELETAHNNDNYSQNMDMSETSVFAIEQNMAGFGGGPSAR